jgi:hypothetical protein
MQGLCKQLIIIVDVILVQWLQQQWQQRQRRWTGMPAMPTNANILLLRDKDGAGMGQIALNDKGGAACLLRR